MQGHWQSDMFRIAGRSKCTPGQAAAAAFHNTCPLSKTYVCNVLGFGVRTGYTKTSAADGVGCAALDIPHSNQALSSRRCSSLLCGTTAR